MSIDKTVGLTTAEVAEKQRLEGFNELEAVRRKSTLALLWGLITEPMILLLLACILIYFFLGDGKEAIMLMISALAIVGISLYQERKSEKSLEALRNLSSPIATVIRNGVHKKISGREVVRGDIIILSEGDRVPADAVLIESTNLKVDESLLTGESIPVDKHTHEVQDYRSNTVFAGSLIVKGHGIAEVVAIGSVTEMGKIGKSLNSIGIEKTLLQKEVGRLIKIIAIAGLVLCIFLATMYALTRGDLVGGFLAGLTLAISIIPEEFPVVLTIFLTMGAWRLAQNKVLTRRAATIETLGGATVLCVDKTGTLTENKMKIMEVMGDKKDVIRFGVLASQKKPFDPMEEAFLASGKEVFGSSDEIYGKYNLIREYPLEDGCLSVAHVWGKTNSNDCLVALKGAPETVFELCRMSKAQEAKELAVVSELAKRGLRLIAIAKSSVALTEIPDDRHDLKFEYLGMVAMADPVRPEVKGAIAECYDAGVRVIMITGDYPETALNIAKKIGLESPGGAVTGSVLAEMSEKRRREVLENTNVFSRVSPEQKLLIVEALKENGEVVAMTGDGVNDAPALKSAAIGIAMGMRGTDVAREAASIVLLDDDFTSIVHGVRLGRRIYANLQKAMAYVLTLHVPIVALSLVPVLFRWPILMFPAHIVFLELITDPTCTLVFEAEKEDADIMKRKPRKIRESVFSKRILLRSVLQGLVIATVTVFMYGYMIINNVDVDVARSMTFVALMAAFLGLVLVDTGSVRKGGTKIRDRHSSTLFIVMGLSVTALFAIIYVPYLADLFKFTALNVPQMLISALIGLASVIWLTFFRNLKGTRTIEK